jgi:hypothetical protein
VAQGEGPEFKPNYSQKKRKKKEKKMLYSMKPLHNHLCFLFPFHGVLEDQSRVAQGLSRGCDVTKKRKQNLYCLSH